jgi:Protein of unknown function (DUF2798)
MALSPKLIGPTISSITGLITSTSMSFVGLALNYGFQPDFVMRWLRAAATSYVVVVPMLIIVIPLPALRHAAGRIAAALRSDRRTKKPRRKPGSKCSRSLRVVPRMVLFFPIEPLCEPDGSVLS